MSIQAIRTAIAEAVAGTVEGLDCLWYAPDSVPEPCFYPHSIEITPSPEMVDRDLVLVTCRLLVSRADDEAGQALLDEFLSRMGPRSVRAALEAARPLTVDGVLMDLQFTSITAYGQYLVGDTYFFGAELIYTVIGG